MYKIKQLPEDFIVKEVSNVKVESDGQYAYYILKKINYTTIDALQVLSNKFKIPLKNFGFAGNKDRNAITEQKISIFRGSKKFEVTEFKNIELKYLGNGKEPISLGDLEGNEFTITISNLNNNEIKKIQSLENKKIKIPNLYGSQRFSKNNNLVGKAIIKRDFKKAVDLVLKNEGVIETKIKDYLIKNKNNHIEALRLIPLKTRKIFVHSYQSYLFNKIANKYLKIKNHSKNNIKIPIIGFDFEIKSIKNIQLKNIIKKITDEENVYPRDFIINRMPELTSEGNFRDLFFELKFRTLEIVGDELNKNRQTSENQRFSWPRKSKGFSREIKINFELPKSCYATVALEFVLR